MGGGTNIKAEALAASDSVPGHLCVTGGCRDVITNICLLMELLQTGVMGEKSLEDRERKILKDVDEKKV